MPVTYFIAVIAVLLWCGSEPTQQQMHLSVGSKLFRMLRKGWAT